MKKLINIIVLVVIAAGLALAVTPASAHTEKVCTTTVTVTGKVQKFGTITGVPATLTADDCATFKIIVHSRGLGNSESLTRSGMARVDAWPSVLNFGMGSIAINKTGGMWTFSQR